jgi:hypothetical protein
VEVAKTTTQKNYLMNFLHTKVRLIWVSWLDYFTQTGNMRHNGSFRLFCTSKKTLFEKITSKDTLLFLLEKLGSVPTKTKLRTAKFYIGGHRGNQGGAFSYSCQIHSRQIIKIVDNQGISPSKVLFDSNKSQTH